MDILVYYKKNKVKEPRWKEYLSGKTLKKKYADATEIFASREDIEWAWTIIMIIVKSLERVFTGLR